jgi:MFS family permease
MPLTGTCANVKPQSVEEASVAEIMRSSEARRGSPWRIVGWGTAVALLATPFVAMELHAEGVNWSMGDFIFAGVIFAIVGGLLELAVRMSKNGFYRFGVALALLGNLLVIWSNLAVGIVGSENNPVNELFFAALLVGIIGACAAGFRAAGLSWAMIATAASLGAAFVIATAFRTDEPNVSHWTEGLGVTIFGLIFVASAGLFRRAARIQSSSSS